jgi:inner membrane protein
MFFKTHFVFNLFIFLILVKMNLFSLTIINFLIVFFASALPDIDIVGSWLSKRTKPASNLVHVFTQHREFFHSLAFILILVIICLLVKINLIYVMLFSLFYFLHILLDCLNPLGIKFFWPLKLKVKGKVRSGGFIEAILFLVFSLACIFLIILLL